MVRSGIPVPSLLALFGALLVLFPEMPMGDPEGFYDVPLTDPIVPLAVAFAVAKHNDRRKESTNYFKLLRVVQMQAQVITGVKYYLTVEGVETEYKKESSKTKIYQKIQECEQLPGNHEIQYP
ncbi:cystatin-1-like [Thamnophis elegans]|uniref:cystatin-1-like n=1 Tax=Thamnophis elegans TaxID=35005 RepID=UPI00137862CC|nr:cystatin-1-like [Thamnophis elegans]